MLGLRVNKEEATKKDEKIIIKMNILLHGTWLPATLDLLFHACLLALSHSGRHASTTVCTLLLCAWPIEGCSAVFAVRVRRYCGFRSLVRAFVVCAEEKQVQKRKLRGLCSLEAIWLLIAELMIQLSSPLQGEHLPSSHVHLAVGTPQCNYLD